MTPAYDIVIVGGGLAGACAAALLVRHAGIEPQGVALLAGDLPAAAAEQTSSERASAGQAPPELRVVAISRASERVLRAAGAWARLDQARLCAYERMRVWHQSGAASGADALCFDAADIGEPNLGYIAENGALLRACIDSFRSAGGTLTDSQLASAAIGPDAATPEP